MAIKAFDIHKSFGDLEVLKGICLETGDGETVAVTGASGAGKSTLLQILGGLARPDSGTVEVDGMKIDSGLSDNALAEFRLHHIGFVFQAHRLLPEFTALENVMIPLMLDGKTRREAAARAGELLALMGLGDRAGHKPSEMSGGECQRVAIARAAANNPSIILADEPTGNLDSATKKNVQNFLFSLRDSLGVSIIIVTHDPELAAACDRTLDIKDGLIL
ncbi:MAG: ABC transporter ATP-binding protein [Bacteroidales bacterium]|nr:ABC transporter ATP-binding protein [Bacteroidales bacterium]